MTLLTNQNMGILLKSVLLMVSKNLGIALEVYWPKGRWPIKEIQIRLHPSREDDVFSKIEKLARLKEIGAITQGEYDNKRPIYFLKFNKTIL